MAQQDEKQTGRSIDVKTLILAAAAAVTAAVVTSFFWKKGTLISTALTPVIVALTQEVLRRPAEKVTAQASRVSAVPARGVTALAGVGARRPPEASRFDERRLLDREQAPDGGSNGANGSNGSISPDPTATPETAVNGAAMPPPPPFDDTRSYDPTRTAGNGDGMADSAPAVAAGQPPAHRVYGRKRFRWKVALLTGLAAFAVAAAVLTVSELALGGSVGGDGRTSLFGGDGGAESVDEGGDEDGSSEDSSDPDAASPDSESQSVAPEEGSSEAAPPEDEAAPEEESVEPTEPAEPVPAEPAPTE